MMDIAATSADLHEHPPRRRRVGAIQGALDAAVCAIGRVRTPGKPVLDSLTGPGAARCAEVIRQYWRQQGKEINITIEPVPGFGTIYQIRSDLINGVAK